MLEQEFKFILSDKEYKKLLTHFLDNNLSFKTIHQKNHYFDTASMAYKKAGYTLKVREYADPTKQMKLFVKQSLLSKNVHLHTNHEYVLYLPKTCVPAIQSFKKNSICTCQSMNRYISHLAGHRGIILYQGFLYTKRMELSLRNLKICLDRNVYNQQYDYEIEFEGKKPKILARYYKNLFSKINIDPAFSTSKSNRFYTNKKRSQ